MDKTIVIVVSQTGLGHATRQIALKDALLKLDKDLKIKFVCNKSQKEMLGRAIKSIDRSKRVIIEEIPFGPQLAMDSWLQVDKESTIGSFQWCVDMDTQVREDRDWERILHSAHLLINDIESFHNPIAQKMGIPIINISNFTWSDILYDLGAKKLAKKYANWEQMADLNIKLPFSTQCRGFTGKIKEPGLLVRKFDYDWVNQFKEKNNQPVVFLSYSRQSWKTNIEEFVKELNLHGFTVAIFERFAKFVEGSSYDIIKIPNITTDVHNYVAACDLVVSKIGYGIASEITSSGTPILFWKRTDFAEDEALANGIEKSANSRELPSDVSPEDLANNVSDLIGTSSDPLPNQTEKFVSPIIDHLS